MCGIDGIVVYGDAQSVRPTDLERMDAIQRHRGPDDHGTWISEDGRTGLGHQRLSIVDLSPTGHQPMMTADISADRGHVIVFNGEIYNYKSLRAELQRSGVVFRSTSDTEVLLHGYREWGGEALLRKLRGMFAFALHDVASKETFFARDPLGIKPLYVSDDGATLTFASEVQTLRAVVADTAVDPEAIASFLFWGAIPPPLTLHRSIRSVPPGCWLRVRPGRVEGPTAYYALEDVLVGRQAMTQAEADERMRAALVDSVSHHLIADVPVGSFLSGGVDSTALVGLMSESHQGPIRTVTLSMDLPDLDEAAFAREAADLYGSEHHEIPTGIEQMRERMMDGVRALDQPSMDGVNTYFVAEAAVKADLKVAVSGVGGDEIFGGYDSFRTVRQIERFHETASKIPGARAALAGARGILAGLPRSPRLARAQRALGGDTPSGAYHAVRGLFQAHEVAALLAPPYRELVEQADPVAELDRTVRPGDLDPSERVGALEIRHYLQRQLLRDTDATSMRHALEVRTPLVDTELLRAAYEVPASLRQAGPAKRCLRNAPRPPVPETLWARRKQGFTMPFDAWIRGGAISTELPENEFLDPAGMAAVRDDFFAGRQTWSRLWALLVLREFLP